MKITGRQLLLVGSVGAVQHSPVCWRTDQLILIKIQLILKKADKLFCLGAKFPFILQFNFLHGLIRKQKSPLCW